MWITGMLRKTALLLLVTCSTLTNCDICPKCIQTQTHGMRSADCYGLNLVEVPQCLRSDLEVIELSFNRLRKISENDLNRYNNLKILYLYDNMIMSIEENALKDKTSLEILDISYNSFTKIPAIIFHLPSLKKLYMTHNQNTNIVRDIEEVKPITSPLEYLNIAFNDLTELPNLGLLPNLLYYNISGNVNVRMNMSNFSGICKLKVLYNNNTSVWFDDPCDCWSLQVWLQKRNVEFQPLNCQQNIVCSTKISLEDMESFNECNKVYDGMIQRANMYKIVLPICVVTLSLIIILLIVFIVRKRRQKFKMNSIKNKIAAEGLL